MLLVDDGESQRADADVENRARVRLQRKPSTRWHDRYIHRTVERKEMYCGCSLKEGNRECTDTGVGRGYDLSRQWRDGRE